MNKFLETFSKEIVINKSISNNFGKIPSYVRDYLISQLVDPQNPNPGILQINKLLNEHYTESSQKESIKSKIKENGRHSLMGNLQVRLDQFKNEYFATVNVLEDSNIRIHGSVLEKFGELLLADDCFGTILVGYDPHTLVKKKNYPFIILDFVPLQITDINLQEYINKRDLFSTTEWIDILMNSIGLNPSKLNQEQKMLYLCRLIIFAESNVNLIELGPVATSKTHFYRNSSQYGLVLSGSNPTIASLFYNKLRRSQGVICYKDFLAFDEISGVKFDNEELINTLKDYMNSGKFSRDRTELSSGCGVIFLGNINTNLKTLEPQNTYQHLFMPLPPKIQGDRAFLDRLNGYIPGWRFPQISIDSLSQDYGFAADYLSEIFHKIRDMDYSHIIKEKIQFKEMGFRNQISVTKLASGLLKIIFPHKTINNIEKEELQLIMDLSIPLRQRVIDQLKIINPGEFKDQEIKYEIKNV
jgi:ATP-dependent Lon protease